MPNILNLIVFFCLVLVAQDCQHSCLLRWRGFLQILIVEISGFFISFFIPKVGGCLLYFIYEAVLMQGENNSADLGGLFDRTEMAK